MKRNEAILRLRKTPRQRRGLFGWLSLPFAAVAALSCFSLQGCSPELPASRGERPRPADRASASRLVIVKSDRPPPDDDGLYRRGVRLYTVSHGRERIHTSIPDVGGLLRGSDLAYFVILREGTGGHRWGERLVDSLSAHADYQRFVDYLLREENRPIKPISGDVKVGEMFHPDSLGNEAHLRRIFSQKPLHLEREEIEKVTPHLRYCTTFRGTLRGVLAQANSYHIGEHRAWGHRNREAGRSERANDLEGFYMELYRSEEWGFTLDVHGVSITGVTPEGKVVEF